MTSSAEPAAAFQGLQVTVTGAEVAHPAVRVPSSRDDGTVSHALSTASADYTPLVLHESDEDWQTDLEDEGAVLARCAMPQHSTDANREQRWC